jgi:hypothetical protein
MGTLVHLRSLTRRGRAADPAEVDTRAFWAPLSVLWLASIARVALAFAHREVFGTEASLALVCLGALPLAAARSWLLRPSGHRKRHGA